MKFLYKGTKEAYWLNEQSLDKCMMYLAYGRECQVKEARVLIDAVAEVLSGKRGKRIPPLIASAADEKPDREAFYRQHPELKTERVVRR